MLIQLKPAAAIGAGARATGRGGASLGPNCESRVRGTAIGGLHQATGFALCRWYFSHKQPMVAIAVIGGAII